MAGPDGRFDGALVKGTADLLVLATLAQDPLHGYGLIARLREVSGERLRLSEGALYPILHRLEREKLVRSSMVEFRGRERRTYAITAAGRRALAARSSAWREFTGFVDQVLRAGGAANGEENT